MWLHDNLWVVKRILPEQLADSDRCFADVHDVKLHYKLAACAGIYRGETASSLGVLLDLELCQLQSVPPLCPAPRTG